MSAPRALPQSRHDIRMLVPTARTLKSIRPTTGGQILLTGLFAGELPLKFSQLRGNGGRAMPVHYMLCLAKTTV